MTAGEINCFDSIKRRHLGINGILMKQLSIYIYTQIPKTASLSSEALYIHQTNNGKKRNMQNSNK